MPGPKMQVRLKLEKDGVVLYEHNYDVYDGESFGRACADAWTQLREQRLERASSVGALFEHLNDQLLDELDGARFSITRL
jgi:hypothetical protein